FFFFQAEDGIRDRNVTGVQTCALPISLMGVAPGAIMAARKGGFAPTEEFDLSTVTQFGAAGAPLPAVGYEWVLEQFGDRVLLHVGCGGTDVCTGILQASPLPPAYSGALSAPSL